MRYSKLAPLLVACAFAVIGGCYYDNFKEIHPSSDVQGCDTTGVISYSKTIQPLFNTSCGTNNSACHLNTSTQSHYGLATYNDVLQDVANGRLIQMLTTNDNSQLMPKNAGRLPDCLIVE